MNKISLWILCSGLLLTLLAPQAAMSHENWDISSVKTEKLKSKKFISHEKDGYLAMNLNFKAVQPVFKLSDNFSYRPLKNRGEAHITVISPIEYKQDLAQYIKITEINEIAKKSDLQNADIKQICLGRGRLKKDDQLMDTYFIVVESEKIMNIRSQIEKLYKERGGTHFDAKAYNPHITIGFTDRDLHFEDGIIKDKKSCMEELHISSLNASYKPLKTIPNTHQLDQQGKGEIIRGNAPLNYKNLNLMKKMGITDVIIFKNDKAGEVASELNGLHDIGYNTETAKHVDFDWKDNNEFQRGCLKYINTIQDLREKMNNNHKVYLHCTTGEDRTGVVSGLYQAIYSPKMSVADIFQKQMCDRGYEAGDKTKSPDVVEKIRAGLTVNFTKMIYLVKQKQEKSQTIDASLCDTDPQAEKGSQDFIKGQKFVCSSATVH